MSKDREMMIEQDYAPERVERDAGFFVRLGWLLALVGAGSFFVWAALAPLDQGIPVQGTVVVSGKRKAVQSMSSGVVSRILVREGESVKQGQPLFRLDQTQVAADVQSLQAQYRMAVASLARWRSERDNLKQVDFPPQLSSSDDPRLALVLEGQRQLFSSRREAFLREQAGIRANIEGATAQLAGMRRARTDLGNQAESLRQQLSNLQPLADNGYIPRNRLLEYQRQLSQVQQELAQNTGESGRIEQGILESRLKLQQHSEEYQKEVRSQLAEAQLKTQTLEQQLTSAGFDLQHSEIIATADGIAVNLGVHTKARWCARAKPCWRSCPRARTWKWKGGCRSTWWTRSAPICRWTSSSRPSTRAARQGCPARSAWFPPTRWSMRKPACRTTCCAAASATRPWRSSTGW